MKDYSDHVRVLKAVLEELSKDNIDDSRLSRNVWHVRAADGLIVEKEGS